MVSITPNLGLTKMDSSQVVDEDVEFNQNYNLIDAGFGSKLPKFQTYSVPVFPSNKIITPEPFGYAVEAPFEYLPNEDYLYRATIKGKLYSTKPYSGKFTVGCNPSIQQGNLPTAVSVTNKDYAEYSGTIYSVPTIGGSAQAEEIADTIVQNYMNYDTTGWQLVGALGASTTVDSNGKISSTASTFVAAPQGLDVLVNTRYSLSSFEVPLVAGSVLHVGWSMTRNTFSTSDQYYMTINFFNSGGGLISSTTVTKNVTNSSESSYQTGPTVPAGAVTFALDFGLQINVSQTVNITFFTAMIFADTATPASGFFYPGSIPSLIGSYYLAKSNSTGSFVAKKYGRTRFLPISYAVSSTVLFEATALIRPFPGGIGSAPTSIFTVSTDANSSMNLIAPLFTTLQRLGPYNG